MIRRLPPTMLVLVLIAACGGGKNSVTGPSTNTAAPPPAATPPPAPAPPPVTRVTLVGVVTDANTGRPLGSATVAVTSTTNTSTTDGNGFFSIPGVAAGSVTMTVTAASYNRATETFTLPASDTRRDIRIVPFWKANGVGNTVFDMPTSVTRVRIVGTYSASGSNFIVRVGGRLVVNEIIGTARTGGPRYEGIHAVVGGAVEITNSRDVIWSFEQVQ